MDPRSDAHGKAARQPGIRAGGRAESSAFTGAAKGRPPSKGRDG